jgi:PAS domain S-box-containing protein
MTEQLPADDRPVDSSVDPSVERRAERAAEPGIERDVEALRASEERFRKAFEASAVGFAIVELDGRIRAVNRSLSEMLGRSREELLTSTFNDITHPDDLASDIVFREQLLAGAADGSHIEKRYFHERGHLVWAVLTVFLVRDAAGAPAYYVAQVVDITARKQAEEALAQHAAELERSNAELEQFAYVASHDLQRPLRTVGSYTQLLAERYADRLDDRAVRWIGYIVGAVARMHRLIDDLLVLARVGMAGTAFVMTDTGSVVTRMWESVRAHNGPDDATLTVGELPFIDADPTQLEQLFQNILGNALKYRRTDIPLHVDVGAVGRRENGVACWEFTVSDNGIGLDMAHAERIFQIFQRLHRDDEYEGTGVGLAICKKIVQRYGGRIWVISSPGQGAAFHFTMCEHSA